MARQWCLSSVVTFVHPTQTVKLFGDIFSPYGSPIILGLPASNIFTKFRRGHPLYGGKYRWGIKISRFSTNKCRVLSLSDCNYSLNPLRQTIDQVGHQLTVPRHRLSTYSRRAFAVAGPTMFNTLPDDLRDPAVSTSTFRQSLKTHLFSAYQHV